MNESLFAIIRDARRRWRLRLLLRGLAITGGTGLVLVLVATWGLDRLRFDAAAVLIVRLLAWGAFAVVLWRVLLAPLARRVTDEQIALYLEEHEPGFEGHLLSAVEFAGRVDGLTSRALVDRLVQGAVARCETLHGWRDLERPGIRRASGALAGTAVAGLVLLALNPAFLRFGAPALLNPFGAPGGDSPYAIAVWPGDTVLARGADLAVEAALRNFDAETVELVLRQGDGDWERWPMPVDETSGRRSLLVFAIDSQATYYVEAGGVRSPLYRVSVEDLPYVASVELEYRFPAYTGLSPRTDEGGDIAALAGTRVRVRVTPTLPVASGTILVSTGDTLALAPEADGTLGAQLTVRAPGTWHVLFPAADGRPVVGSPEYFIEVLEDQPPLVRFRAPGRDLDVTNIDEVFIEAEAEDDFGVRRLDLVYRVNGGPEDTVSLWTAGVRSAVTAGHTLFLEEFPLQPGDFVSYYARAVDARPEAPPVLTDIYFLSIRPFDRAFQEADQQGMQGGGGTMGAGDLSRQQRDIIAATFRVRRDRRSYTDDEFRDHMTTLTLSQGRLREDVETLARRIGSRGIVDMDSTMAPVAEALPQAAEAMRRAENALGRGDPDDALTPEQEALQHLQRAEAIFRREQQVSRNDGQPNGGAGGNPISEELSELFDLEADRLRNQYEQADRDVREQTNQQIDETLEKLRELARRQQQQDERRRARERQGGAAAGTPSDAQRRLAEETEEEARRLERLARERRRPDLAEAARRLREAADAMRRSAAGRQQAAAGSALDRLQEAGRRLEESRSAGLERAVQDALERARRLGARQDEVERDVEGLDRGDRAARDQRVRRLGERKEMMADEVGALEDQLERTAREAQAERPEAAAGLRDAARGIRQSRLEDKIRYSRGVVEQRSTDYARNFEESIGADLDSLTARLEAAAAALDASPEETVERTLDRTRELTNALESLQERLQRGNRGGGDSGQAGQAGDANDRRQMARELGQRRGELEGIRDELRRQGVNTGELDDLLRTMGRWDNPNAIGTPRALEDLAGVIVPGLKEFEFALRRALLEQGADPAAAASLDRVAPAYRAMVEEYYRQLGRRR